MAEQLTVTAVAERSGFAPSALRYYEAQGLIEADRSPGGRRRYDRDVLRRLAFIAAAKHVGLGLDEIRGQLDRLPGGRTPTARDWSLLSRSWRRRLDAEIEALEALRDGLDGCIGCGCLSLDRCGLSNPDDVLASRGPGAAFLPAPLRPTTTG